MVAYTLKKGNTMKKLLISSLIVLSSSLAHAETDPYSEAAKDCDQAVTTNVINRIEIASNMGAKANYSIVEGIKDVQRNTAVNYDITPYVGVCDEAENDNGTD